MEGKKSFKLTRTDILEHPIWVRSMDAVTYGDSDGEDWDDEPGLYRPLPSDPQVVQQLFDNCICLARARFVAANGRSFLGMIKCWAGEEIENSHPTIILDDRQVDFYFGSIRPTEREIATAYEELEIAPGELFPLAYSVDVSLPDAPPDGVVEGFCYREPSGDDFERRYLR